MESLLGAVYVDSGGDMDATWAVAQARCVEDTQCTELPSSKLHGFEHTVLTRAAACLPGTCLQKLLHPMVTPDTLAVHPIRRLQVRAPPAHAPE